MTIPSNSAPQETRGDEPVARKCKADFYALWCDNCNLHPANCPLRALAASQQSPQLDREDLIQAIDKASGGYNPCRNAVVDAILALVPPDTTKEQKR